MVWKGGEIEVVKRYALPRRAAGGLGHMRQTLYAAVWGLNKGKRIKGTGYQRGSARQLGKGARGPMERKYPQNALTEITNGGAVGIRAS